MLGARMNVPQSTLEKPLTAIDYIVAMEQQCSSLSAVQRFAEQVPLTVREDERFTRAVAKRLATIKARA